MKEYMVHVWSGACDTEPSKERDFGIKEGYHYFSTEKEKDDFLDVISLEKYSKQGLIKEVKYGEMSHKRTIFTGIFEYHGKVFILHKDFGYDCPEEQPEFLFLYGSYSCDCQRSLFIRREYSDESVPELECGSEIKLIDYHFEYEG